MKIINETINNSARDTLVFRNVSGTDIQEQFLYTTPYITEKNHSTIKLLFCCKDINGKRVERALILYVISTASFLNETTGHTMYSANSSEFNAYDLLNGLPMYSSDSTAHIYDNSDSLSTVLGRRWDTYTGILFTRANSFD